MGPTLVTDRLLLVPITLPLVEAVLDGRRADAEAILGARFPRTWPGRDLVERAFCAHLDRIREDPEHRLWGDRVALTREAPRVVGSVVFHGGPDADGLVEVAYGIEPESQGFGYATEAVRAAVDWALVQPEVQRVCAQTTPFHTASRRVLEKVGMRLVGAREHDIFGEVVEYQRGREISLPPAYHVVESAWPPAAATRPS